jgi:YfiH family protein
MYFESDLLRKVPGIMHGFGSKWDPVPNTFLKTWVDLRPTWQQTHGTDVGIVVKRNQLLGDVDAMYTKSTNPIGVVTADCLPILLARKDGGAVAAIHSGWRGTKAHIVEKVAIAMQAQGEDLSQWVAAIGPSIGKCCYEVSEEMIEDFIKSFPDIEPDTISPTPRKLDLAAVNGYELGRVGISAVDFIEECTSCSMDPAKGPIFHSYRREGSGVRQWSLISRKKTV